MKKHTKPAGAPRRLQGEEGIATAEFSIVTLATVNEKKRT